MDGENNKTINDVDWEKKYYEKEHEWNGKEKIYVGDLLKQTKELQMALLLIEGVVKIKITILILIQFVDSILCLTQNVFFFQILFSKVRCKLIGLRTIEIEAKVPSVSIRRVALSEYLLQVFSQIAPSLFTLEILHNWSILNFVVHWYIIALFICPDTVIFLSHPTLLIYIPFLSIITLLALISMYNCFLHLKIICSH